jgi:hypothetical protein
MRFRRSGMASLTNTSKVNSLYDEDDYNNSNDNVDTYDDEYDDIV